MESRRGEGVAEPEERAMIRAITPVAWMCAECGGTDRLCPHSNKDIPLYIQGDAASYWKLYQALDDLWEEYALQSGQFGDNPIWEKYENIEVIERVKQILEDGKINPAAPPEHPPSPCSTY